MRFSHPFQTAAQRFNAWVSQFPPAVQRISQIPMSGVKRVQDLSGVVGQGRYQIEGQVGTGSMGVVYGAWHTQLHRHVAIKVLRPEYRSDHAVVERFLNEARVAALIECDNVVRVLDCGKLESGAPYFAMELLDGVPLSEVLGQNKSLPVFVAVEIAEQVANGLAAAHAKNVIHRDLKPENVMLINSADELWRAKIVDFGIAKALDSAEEMTTLGHIFGTPQYMSPEQTLGAQVDHRSDIYALGVLMYEMLSGKLPVSGKHVRDILAGQRQAPLPPLRSQPSAHAVPPRLEAIVHRCLEKDPDRRYPSVQVLLRDLRQFCDRNRAANDNGMQTVVDLPALSSNFAPRRSLPAVIPRGRSAVERDYGTLRLHLSIGRGARRTLLGCVVGAIIGMGFATWLNSTRQAASAPSSVSHSR